MPIDFKLQEPFLNANRIYQNWVLTLLSSLATDSGILELGLGDFQRRFESKWKHLHVILTFSGGLKDFLVKRKQQQAAFAGAWGLSSRKFTQRTTRIQAKPTHYRAYFISPRLFSPILLYKSQVLLDCQQFCQSKLALHGV